MWFIINFGTSQRELGDNSQNSSTLQRFTFLLNDLMILLLVQTVEDARFISISINAENVWDSDVAPGKGFEPLGSLEHQFSRLAP
jgi:hypothetical protein